MRPDPDWTPRDFVFYDAHQARLHLGLLEAEMVKARRALLLYRLAAFLAFLGGVCLGLALR